MVSLIAVSGLAATVLLAVSLSGNQHREREANELTQAMARQFDSYDTFMHTAAGLWAGSFQVKPFEFEIFVNHALARFDDEIDLFWFPASVEPSSRITESSDSHGTESSFRLAELLAHPSIVEELGVSLDADPWGSAQVVDRLHQLRFLQNPAQIMADSTWNPHLQPRRIAAWCVDPRTGETFALILRTTVDRQDQIVGACAALINVERVLAVACTRAPHPVALRLVTHEGHATIAHASVQGFDAAFIDTVPSIAVPISMFGRDMTLAVRWLAFDDPAVSPFYLVLACGCALTAMSCVLLYREQRHGKATEAIVARRTSELRALTAMFDRSIQATSEGLWEWNLRTMEVWTSPRFSDLLGCTADDVPDRVQHVYELLHSDDRQKVEQKMQQSIEQHESHDLEFRLRVEDGSYQWFRAQGTIHAVPGQPRLLSGSIQNIHSRRTLELEREQLIAGLNDRVRKLSALQDIAWILRSQYDSCTVQLQEIVGRLPWALTQSDYAQACIVVDQHEASTNQYIPCDGHLLVEIKTNDLAIGSISVSYPDLPSQLADSTASENDLGFLRLVAELLASQFVNEQNLSRLRASDTRYRTIVSNIPGTVYRTAMQTGRPVQFVSDAISQIVACGPDVVCQQGDGTLDRFVHPEDSGRVRQAIEQAIQRKEQYEIQYRMCVADNRECWVLDRGRPVISPDGESWFDGVLFDITDQREVEELRSERMHLQHAIKAMEQVLGVVSHELRSPLAAIRASSELILQLPPGDEQHRFLENIHRESIRMAEMVNNLLEAARLNSGAARWKWDRVNVASIVQDLQVSMGMLIDSDLVTLECVASDEKLHMQGDANGIRRVLVNLLTNAVKHTRSGEIRVEARERTGKRRQIEMIVTDTGTGIPGNVLQQLGQVFSLNAGSLGSSYIEGAGLGLAICRAIVEVHGGTMSFQSKLREGTTVRVLLDAELPGPVEIDTSACEVRRVAA